MSWATRRRGQCSETGQGSILPRYSSKGQNAWDKQPQNHRQKGRPPSLLCGLFDFRWSSLTITPIFMVRGCFGQREQGACIDVRAEASDGVWGSNVEQVFPSCMASTLAGRGESMGERACQTTILILQTILPFATSVEIDA